jgi:protein TonB
MIRATAAPRLPGLLPLAAFVALSLVMAGAVVHAASKAAPIRPSFNAYFPSDFTDAAYQKDAVSRVSKQWAVRGGLPARGSKTVIASTIARDGSLVATVVTMKSGSKEWDDAALAAVKKAAPFTGLPSGYPQSKIEVHWHFSAN